MGALGVGALCVALLVGVGLAVDPAAAQDGEPDGNLSVVVTDGIEPTPTVSPATSTPPTRPRGSNPGGPRPGDVVQETISDPAEADNALGVDPAGIGGLLAISGLTPTVSPTFAPGNGPVTLTFTVRSNSSTTFDSTARFWITNPVGGRIADERRVQVNALTFGETRRISVTFSALGQHTVLNGHVRLTPPKTVDGTQLRPLDRDTTFVLAPLLALSIGGGITLTGWLLWRFLATRGRIRIPSIARIAT